MLSRTESLVDPMDIPATLRRFWDWLGGTNRTSDIVPTNFDNLQAVPVIPVYQFGGDDGNKAPRLYPPVNDDGFHRTKTSVVQPTGSQTVSGTYTDANTSVVSAGATALLTFVIPAGQSCTVNASGTPVAIAATQDMVIGPQMVYGPVNLDAGAGESGAYFRTYMETAQVTDAS
jgi:hypothetical protein